MLERWLLSEDARAGRVWFIVADCPMYEVFSSHGQTNSVFFCEIPVGLIFRIHLALSNIEDIYAFTVSWKAQICYSAATAVLLLF